MKIIMYHYVRNLKDTKYKKLKALDIENFKKQIKYLSKNFTFFNPNESIKKNLNKKTCWLTFDDGYSDHYKYVLPVLEDHKIKGSFFITSNIENKKILEVNKIQFLLERKKSSFLLSEIKKYYNSKNKLNNDNEINNIISNINLDHRYDNKITIIVKRLLQRELNDKLKKEIINYLFTKFITKDEIEFHEELYLNIKNLKEMKSLGHEIGNHTKSHMWLSRLSADKQKKEIIQNLNFLKKNKLIGKKWTMCYPFGDFNNDTLKIIKNLNCTRAISTIVGNANVNDNIFKLPRLNTNDFFPIKKN